MVYCGKCGTENSDDDGFCTVCGNELKLENKSKLPQKVSKEVDIPSSENIKKKNNQKKGSDISGEGIMWMFIMGFIGIFIPGVIPLGFLGGFGPLLGIIIGGAFGYYLGKATQIKREEKDLIRKHQAQEIREKQQSE